MTKKELNRIWNLYKKNNDFEYFYENLSRHYDAKFVFSDWKDTEDLINQFKKILLKFDINVIDDPVCEGSDQFGFIVMKNDKLIEKNNDIIIYRTSHVGELEVTYKDLVKVFGKPDKTISGDNKVSCTWKLRSLKDNTIITIYDYKIGIPYLGPEEGKIPEEITKWSIGSDKKYNALKVLHLVLLPKLGKKYNIH